MRTVNEILLSLSLQKLMHGRGESKTQNPGLTQAQTRPTRVGLGSGGKIFGLGWAGFLSSAKISGPGWVGFFFFLGWAGLGF